MLAGALRGVGVEHERNVLGRCQPVDVGGGDRLERGFAVPRGQRPHDRVLEDALLVVVQVAVHRLLVEAEGGQQHRFLEPPAVAAGDRRAHPGQELRQVQLRERLDRGQVHAEQP